MATDKVNNAHADQLPMFILDVLQHDVPSKLVQFFVF
jgi:hypothetical protein